MCRSILQLIDDVVADGGFSGDFEGSMLQEGSDPLMLLFARNESFQAKVKEHLIRTELIAVRSFSPLVLEPCSRANSCTA